MATRSRIAIKNDDGTYTSIYCHYDGYVEGVGAELVNHFDDREKIKVLMDGGDCSSIDNGVVETYRSLGETGTDAVIHPTFEKLTGYFEEYNYVFDNDTWFVYRNDDDFPKSVSKILFQ